MRIIASVMDLKTGEMKDIEETGGNRVKVLLLFMAKTRKYANPDHKVLHVATDDLTTYSEFKTNYPNMLLDLLETEEEKAAHQATPAVTDL